MSYLEIKNFIKSFDKTEVLKDISFTMEKGEVLSVIGSSGSGKTTLLRCLNFLESPDGGKMVLDGEQLIDADGKAKESEKALREKRLNFGLVFQSFNLFPQYTVLKNITLAPTLLLKTELKELKKTLKEEKKPRREISAILKERKVTKKREIEKEGGLLLDKIGLSDKKDAYPDQLSGGQSQRVAIARALALKPKILCFDEPTSALDPELTGEVLRVIKSLKDDGRTMIIVTHEMGFAQKVSDKVIFMANGIIEEQGSPDELFNNPKSEKLKSFLISNNDKEGI